MAKHTEDDYIFSCVVVRSEEVNLLSEADMDKLIEQPTVQSAMNMLADFGYGNGKELANPRDFEYILRDNLEKAYETIYSVIPDEKEMNLFAFPNDYHNAKVLLKSEFLKIDPTPYILHTGTINPEDLEDCMKKRDFSGLSVHMRTALQEAIDTFAKTRDPQEIDIILDRGCYRDMLNDAEDSEEDPDDIYISEYIRLLIDTVNINTFVRLKKIEKNKNFFRKVFLEGGNFDEDSIEAEADRFLAEIKDGQFEKHLDDRKMEFIKDARFVPFGIQPIVGFLVAKETEIKNLRMILTGKIANTPADIIKSRLRETYV